MHPELSGCITTLSVCNTEVANFCAAMDTLIDQDVWNDVVMHFSIMIIYVPECTEVPAKVPEPDIGGSENFPGINTTSALLVLVTSLDREVNDRYVLQIKVVDNSSATQQTGYVNIRVLSSLYNDSKPQRPTSERVCL